MDFSEHIDFRYFREADRKIIKSQSLKAEQAGRYTTPLLDLTYEKKLFHLLVPKLLGGHQCPLPDALHCFEEASYLDGSFGWTLTLGAGAGVFSAYLNEEFAEKIFAHKKAFIAGSGFPAGKAVPVDGGFNVSGTWKYISGWPHATLFTGSCIIKRENHNDNEPAVRAFAFLPEQVEILNHWSSYGLKATASDDMKVTDQFVPEERVFVLTPEAAKVDAPLYTFPFEPFAQCTLAISLLGIAERFLDESAKLVSLKSPNKKTPFGSLYAQACIELQEARTDMYRHVQTCWEYYEKSNEASPNSLKEIKKLSSRLNKTALKSVHAVYPHLGMEVLDENSTANRAWRDLHTASQHTFLTPEVEG